MDCDGVLEVLSAYYDAQLPQDERDLVAEHLGHCTQCVAELAVFQRLSALVRSAPASDPPALWPSLATQLEADTAVAFPRTRGWSVPARWLLSAAALLLIGLLGWWGYGGHGPTGHEERFAADFSKYLNKFARDPDGAQRFLAARYHGTLVAATEAAVQMGYDPLIASGLPPEYTIVSAYVWEMPCCRCLQLVCQRSDGSTLAIFEHNEPQPEWFQGRQTAADSCGGRECKVVKLDRQLAATWDRGGRQVTVIGARSLAEVEELLSALDLAAGSAA